MWACSHPQASRYATNSSWSLVHPSQHHSKTLLSFRLWAGTHPRLLWVFRTGRTSRQGSWWSQLELVAERGQGPASQPSPWPTLAGNTTLGPPPARISMPGWLHHDWTRMVGAAGETDGEACPLSPPRNGALLGVTVGSGVARVSSLVRRVANQAANKLEPEIPRSRWRNLPRLAVELFPSRTNQQLGRKRMTEEIWPRAMEARLEGRWVGKTGRCQNLTPNACPVSTTAPISLCLPSRQEALLSQAAIVFWSGAKTHQSANKWALQTQSTGLTLGYIFSKFIFIVCKLCLSDSKS